MLYMPRAALEILLAYGFTYIYHQIGVNYYPTVRDRLQVVAITDNYADLCFVSQSIHTAWHGHQSGCAKAENN